MNDFIDTLTRLFEENANPQVAAGQKAYMKNQFDFYGIKTPLRRKIQRPFFSRKYLPEKSELKHLVAALWEKPQREFQYFAQELMEKYIRQMEEGDMALFEYAVTHKSWWDTVDFIAAKLMGAYFKAYPGERDERVRKWLDSNNIWLQRSALLFQLNYKNELDTAFLTDVIHSLLGSKEFFINKAIGWILRQYSKVNPEWVNAFANRTPLDKLSYKEAVRLIN